MIYYGTKNQALAQKSQKKIKNLTSHDLMILQYQVFF
jgi:hypothetical protein